MLGMLNRDQIDQLLRSEAIGRLGCHANRRTYVVPVTYVYDGTAIYGHSGDGLKLRMMRANPNVCFEVDHVDTMASWQSVIAWATFEELRGPAAQHAMHLLVNRLMPLIAGTPPMPTEGVGETDRYRIELADGQAVIYQLNIVEITGRFEQR